MPRIVKLGAVAKRAKKRYRKLLKRAKKSWATQKYRVQSWFFVKRRNAYVSTVQYFRRRRAFYLTLLYFTFAVLVASLSQLWFTPTIRPETAFGFYTAAGAMAGGTLAIIFTFNTLLVNFAQTQYPPQFFKLSGYDKKQDKVYFVVALLTIGLFVMGFMYREGSSDWNYYLTLIGLFALFAVFYLIFLSYSLTRRRLNPIASFGYITRPAHKLLEQCEKDAKQLADMLRKNPNLKPDKAYTADYQPHILLQAQYEQFNEFLGYLYDYHDKLLDKKDYSAALMVLDAIGGLVVRYIDVRKNTFIMLPSDYILVPTTDAQKFFDANFQRLLDRAKVYMKLGNQDGMRKVLGLFEGFGLKLRELEFPKMQHENPPFAQCIAYMGYFTEEAIKQKDLEATFQLARTYGVLGSVAINKHYMHILSTIYDDLLKLAMHAGGQKQWVVTDQVAQAFSMLAQAFTQRQRGALSTEFHIYMDKLGEFYWYYAALTAKTPSVDFQANTMEHVLRPLRIVTRWMEQLVKDGSNTRNGERDSAQHDVIELAELLWRLLRALSDRQFVSLADRYFGTQLTDVIEDACALLITSAYKNGWQRHSDEALKQASWLLNQISFFTNNAPDNMESHQLDELSKKATNISLFALHKGNTKLAIDGINVNYYLAITCLNKSTKAADYAAPRIMVNACIIAVLAMHRQNGEVLRHAKEMAVKFNQAYAKKYFPNGFGLDLKGRGYLGTYPQQLFAELKRMGPDIYEFPSRMDDMMELPENYLKKLAPTTEKMHYAALIKYFKAGSYGK